MRDTPERYLLPQPANERRARTLAGYRVREAVIEKFRKGIEVGGLSFPDAAEAAGMPFELALSQIHQDEDFQRWFQMAKGRKVLAKDESAGFMPDLKSVRQLNEEFIRTALGAGLKERLAETIAHLRPVDDEGRIDGVQFDYLERAANTLARYMPKMNENLNVNQDAKPLEKLSDADLMREITARRERRMAAEQQIERARAVRASGGTILEGPKRVIDVE